jgi:hypothetical protein
VAIVDKTAASIGFHGDDLDPDEITRALGQPTKGVRKGEVYFRPGNVRRVARTGQWSFSVEDAQPGDLDQQIRTLFASLSDDLGAWRDFTTRYKSWVFVGLFLVEHNEGLSLSPETLSAIGARGLELELDIYSARDIDDDEDDGSKEITA